MAIFCKLDKKSLNLLVNNQLNSSLRHIIVAYESLESHHTAQCSHLVFCCAQPIFNLLFNFLYKSLFFFSVCLGGDGTLLYASSLFQQSVPPVMAFHLGSLGFLTPFEFQNFEQQVTHVLEGNFFIFHKVPIFVIFFREIDL